MTIHEVFRFCCIDWALLLILPSGHCHSRLSTLKNNNGVTGAFPNSLIEPYSLLFPSFSKNLDLIPISWVLHVYDPF